jgi:hypothetical protein
VLAAAYGKGTSFNIGNDDMPVGRYIVKQLIFNKKLTKRYGIHFQIGVKIRVDGRHFSLNKKQADYVLKIVFN